MPTVDITAPASGATVPRTFPVTVAYDLERERLEGIAYTILVTLFSSTNLPLASGTPHILTTTSGTHTFSLTVTDNHENCHITAKLTREEDTTITVLGTDMVDEIDVLAGSGGGVIEIEY